MNSYEHRMLADKFASFATQVVPGMGAAGQAVLQGHLETLLWHIDCLLKVAKGPVNLDNIGPGFGLLICKRATWLPVTSRDKPNPVSGEAQDAMRSLISSIGELILPLGDRPGMHHVFTTYDGLVCMFYRMEDRSIIFKAAGVDEGVIEPAHVLH